MNDGTFFDGGVDLNPEFQEMRNRGKTNFQISKQAKENLERSILEGQDYTTEKSFTVDAGNGAISCVNGLDNDNLPPENNRP